MSELEHNIQSAFVDSVLWQYRSDPTFLRPLFFAVPNGAFLGAGAGRDEESRRRSSRARAIQMEKLRKEGFRKGVSDMLYLQPRGEWSYLAMEFKREDRKTKKGGGGVSDDQKEFIEAVEAAGGLPYVFYTLDEAIEAFARYMALDPRDLDRPLQVSATESGVMIYSRHF